MENPDGIRSAQTFSCEDFNGTGQRRGHQRQLALEMARPRLTDRHRFFALAPFLLSSVPFASFAHLLFIQTFVQRTFSFVLSSFFHSDRTAPPLLCFFFFFLLSPPLYFLPVRLDTQHASRTNVPTRRPKRHLTVWFDSNFFHYKTACCCIRCTQFVFSHMLSLSRTFLYHFSCFCCIFFDYFDFRLLCSFHLFGYSHTFAASLTMCQSNQVKCVSKFAKRSSAPRRIARRSLMQREYCNLKNVIPTLAVRRNVSKVRVFASHQSRLLLIILLLTLSH